MHRSIQSALLPVFNPANPGSDDAVHIFSQATEHRRTLGLKILKMLAPPAWSSKTRRGALQRGGLAQYLKILKMCVGGAGVGGVLGEVSPPLERSPRRRQFFPFFGTKIKTNLHHFTI